MGCKNSISAASTEAFSEDWCLGRKLGEGSFSQVYAVSHKKSSRTAALKIPKESRDYLRDSFMAKKEAKIWKAAGRHANIVELIDDFVIDRTHVILMERCDHTLTQHMADMQVGFEPVVARMLYQLTSAVAHLHSLNIVHRDVKPDNFLCSSDQMLKLCDFGFAALMPTSGKLYGRCGTPFYMSPEMVSEGPHSLKTDVWSLGVICYLMLYGEHPYLLRSRSGESVMRAVAEGTSGPKYQGRCFISSQAKEFATVLLHRSPDARASAAEALDMPFLNLTSEEASASISQSRKSSGALMDILSESQSTCEPCSCDSYETTSQTSKSSKATSLPNRFSL